MISNDGHLRVDPQFEPSTTISMVIPWKRVRGDISTPRGIGGVEGFDSPLAIPQRKFVLEPQPRRWSCTPCLGSGIPQQSRNELATVVVSRARDRVVSEFDQARIAVRLMQSEPHDFAPESPRARVDRQWGGSPSSGTYNTLCIFEECSPCFVG